MIIPPLPDNEAERLRSLYALKILDTPPEERFDRLTRLAAQFFDMPMSLVTLLDADRQWFKSEYGLGIRELPREISFCGHTILQDGVMVVPDATQDERFAGNPAVGGKYGVYFYAGHPIYSPEGSALGTICILDNKPREIPQRLLENLKDWAKLVEQEICNVEVARLNRQLRASEEQIRKILEQCQDAFIAMTDDGRVTEWNPKAETLFGWSRQEAVGQLLAELIVPEHIRPANGQELATTWVSDTSSMADQRVELMAVRRGGEEFPVEMTVGLIDTGQGRLFTAFLHDISQRKRDEDLLRQQALQDALTGLPNRHALFCRLTEALTAVESRGQGLALLFFDLDRFKQINDSYGHAAGDQLLVQFAQRLKKLVRQSDFVARLAGDEFVILLEQLPQDSQVAVTVAGKIIEAMAEPFGIDEQCIECFTSIGIVEARQGGVSPDELLRRADQAMYAAKRAGSNQYRVFDAEQDVA